MNSISYIIKYNGYDVDLGMCYIWKTNYEGALNIFDIK